jgi:signal transduction histidine kinase
VLKKNKAKAVISVEDWGCGIDEIDLPKIFEPLFTTKSLEKGTGIGLSVSREIIKNYFKGSIKVKSKKGVGSTFTISFPLSKAPVYRLKKEKS